MEEDNEQPQVQGLSIESDAVQSDKIGIIMQNIHHYVVLQYCDHCTPAVWFP